MDESTLIDFAKQGDLDAFNRLVLTYQDVAFNVAYRLMGDPAEAEDVTQDAFISAYRKLNTFRGGSFKAWVLRIVTNAAYDALRKRKRRPTTPLEPLNPDDEEVESPVWMADPGESPEDTAARTELSRAIQDCLDGLDVDFRAVVVMVDVQGLGYNEAAAAVGKPLGTVKSRLARARLRMQDCLQGYGELLPAQFRLEGERI
ncbi:MAG: sigma-70 family RNA polymerase sigma factor [Anaerolineae bacterium]|nr:sigma-70 family RNA polymerase sigma factor [Anaerolineae bacterium]